MKSLTIRDIARLAGVSVTTVSRVLNHRPDVNADTREHVERVIRQHHFVGNSNARELKQSNDVIGLIIRGRSNPFLNALAEAILDRADAVAPRFLTEYIDEREDEFLTALHMLQRARVLGFIFVGSKVDQRAQVIQSLDLPMVFTTVSADGFPLPRAASIAIDDSAMGYLVAEQLLNLGHRRIAVFGANPVAGDSLARRFDGFCRAFKDRGLTYDPALFRETRFSLQAGYQTAREFIRSHPDITALFAMSDTVAIGAMRAFSDLHMRIPEDISVFGFDGIDLSDFTLPRLATVEQPVNEIARSSVELLMEMLNENAPPRQLLVNAKLRRRESLAPPCTGLPSGADSRV